MLRERVEEISFYEALALIVEQSGLRQVDIVNKSNERLAKLIEQAKLPPLLEALLQLVPALNAGTLSNILKAKDLPSDLMLYRIVLGLGLEEEEEQKTLELLENLRKLEKPRNHSSGKLRIVKGGKKPQIYHDIPSWI